MMMIAATAGTTAANNNKQPCRIINWYAWPCTSRTFTNYCTGMLSSADLWFAAQQIMAWNRHSYICKFKLELWSRDAQIWGKICFELCDLDLRPLTLTLWTSGLSMVITLENFRMIRWQEHCQKGVMDGRTDRQKEVFLELLGRS